MIPVATALLILVALWSQIDRHRAATKLRNLRANAFVTNERGHRVRYANASPAEQARAEAE